MTAILTMKLYYKKPKNSIIKVEKVEILLLEIFLPINSIYLKFIYNLFARKSKYNKDKFTFSLQLVKLSFIMITG